MKKSIKELMQLDVKFCEESKTLKEEGWSKYLSKDAIMGTSKHEPYIDKKNKIVNLVSMIYKLENLDFSWQPVYAFLSNDETLGVTTGTYKRMYKIEEEIYTEIGKYMTVWKKEDEDWKIVFDMGN